MLPFGGHNPRLACVRPQPRAKLENLITQAPTNESMKTRLSVLALVMLSNHPGTFAQDKAPVDDWKPSPSNQTGKEYPQVNSEGRVKFRIVAPKAQSVGVSFRDSSAFTK